MYSVELKTMTRTLKNNGQHAEQLAVYTLLNEIRKPDKVPFDKGSDIPEFNMSIKSSRFTLASDTHGETVAEHVNDYFNRVASTSWGYVAENGKMYVMNKVEFTEFLKIALLTKLDRNSSKNGCSSKVRAKKENNTIRQWLENHC